MQKDMVLQIAADISEEALAVARENAERHGVADRIAFIQGNLFEPLRGLNLKADLIVSNPPYISKKMWAELQPEVKDYEPSIALYGGEDGLDFYRRIISESPEYLTAGGCLMLEMGYGQAEKIKNLIVQGNMFENVTIIKDFAGIDRVIKARRKG
ncbi:MAG: peptide chain release factor N(5)-glutamine methyltransferase [Deltaproteobacteria bacterium]|nr:peptide chain release factor N(5)-glutamine methyltransferase [Deltaproteobacteria bacterium]